MITLIAAIDPNNVIGKSGKTPWHIPEELKLFKEITYGHAIIVGRKTYESIGHTLPGRRMFVLSRTVPLLTKEGLGEVSRDAVPPLTPPSKGGEITFCSSIQDALEKTKQERSVFVIGGGQVYAQMMPFAHEMRISHLHAEYPGDVYFPHVPLQVWQELSRIEYPLFTHIHYVRNDNTPAKN